jgi:hypothetical protein
MHDLPPEVQRRVSLNDRQSALARFGDPGGNVIGLYQQPACSRKLTGMALPQNLLGQSIDCSQGTRD